MQVDKQYCNNYYPRIKLHKYVQFVLLFKLYSVALLGVLLLCSPHFASAK